MNNILSCPACGEEAREIETERTGSISRWHRVECSSCETAGPMVEGCSFTYFGAKLINEYATKAIDGWNAFARSFWRPIESAPKDGTEIILFGMVPDGPRVTAGFWLVPEPPVVGDCGGECHCPEYGEPLDPDWVCMHGGSAEGWMSNDGGFADKWPATHWMPLPAPPRNDIGAYRD